MVGYRNGRHRLVGKHVQLIRHSDGGVPELSAMAEGETKSAYQAFRWWGTGT